MKKLRCLMIWDDILDQTLRQDRIKIKNLWSPESNAMKIKTEELHIMGKDIFMACQIKSAYLTCTHVLSSIKKMSSLMENIDQWSERRGQQ